MCMHAPLHVMLLYRTFVVCPLLAQGRVTLDTGPHIPASSKCGSLTAAHLPRSSSAAVLLDFVHDNSTDLQF